MCALGLYALVAHGIFVSSHDDKVAFHRAEPEIRISIPGTQKDSAYLTKRRLRDAE